VLVDLRRNIRREPARSRTVASLNARSRSVSRPAGILLVRAPDENGKRRNAQTIRGELRALTGALLVRTSLALAYQAPSFVHAGPVLCASVLDKSDIMRLVHEDMMPSDQDASPSLSMARSTRMSFRKDPLRLFRSSTTSDPASTYTRAGNSKQARCRWGYRCPASGPISPAGPERKPPSTWSLEFQDESRHLLLSSGRSRTNLIRCSASRSSGVRAASLRKDAQQIYTDVVDAAIFNWPARRAGPPRSVPTCFVRIVLRFQVVTMRDNPSEHSNNESPASNIVRLRPLRHFRAFHGSRQQLCISLASVLAASGFRSAFFGHQGVVGCNWSSVPA